MRRSNAAGLCVVDLQHAVVCEEPVHLGLDVAHLREAWILHICRWNVVGMCDLGRSSYANMTTVTHPCCCPMKNGDVGLEALAPDICACTTITGGWCHATSSACGWTHP